MRSPSESTAVWPGFETCRSIPLLSSQSWTLASESLTPSTIDGTSSRNAETWLATGFASSTPMPATASSRTR